MSTFLSKFFFITSIFDTLYFIKSHPIFDELSFIIFTKYNDFLRVCWFWSKILLFSNHLWNSTTEMTLQWVYIKQRETERESTYILRIQKRQPNARWSQTRFSRLNLKATYFGSVLQVDKVHIFWEGHKIFAISSTYFWLQCIQSKVRGRFRKILWPSQNIWTLIVWKSLLSSILSNKFIEWTF